MIKPGICSITFRQKSPEEIIALSLEAGLAGIEWGADVHVPPEDLENARRVGEMTREAGLEVVAYGSYWFALDEQPEPEPFEPLIEAAQALGAPIIRIWAGSLGLEKSPAYFETVVGRTRVFAEAAAQAGIKLALEHHPNTFTETLEGSLKLLDAVEHPNLYTYWQPPHGSSLEERLEEIAALKQRLLNLHVSHWGPAKKLPYPRLPLAEGASVWKPCLFAVDDPSIERFALLEFVRDDDPRQFKADASILSEWLS
ncbi:MAG: sugar phosphate isomerase/epimerase [Kiritimatiellales bacterium]|nr:sugar phosphate isomerase/epimerase [Kiritimatiellales bacterium]